MTIFPTNVDYTQKDFQALKLRLQGLIRSVYPLWTDFNVANFGNVLLESFCHVGDVMTYNQDSQARESYWSTVSERINAIRLGRHINFQLTSATSATGICRFSVVEAPPAAIPIPYNTRLRTPGPNSIMFKTIETGKEISTTPVGGLYYIDVAVRQAIAVGYRDPATGDMIGGESFISSGAANQKYITLQAPVVDDTIDIEGEDGEYRQVSSFLDNDPVTGNAINENSRVFVSTSNADGFAVIAFGNGRAGKIPEGITIVTYMIGGGSVGNVEAGQITVIDSVNSSLATVGVTNPSAMSGGANRMTVRQARSRGPQSLRVLERCVTQEDFEITALSVPGVARAAMLTSNEDATVQENAGTLLIVALGEQLDSGRIAAATPSSVLLASILSEITNNKPPPLTFSLSVASTAFRTVDVSTRVYLEPGVNSVTVGQAIRDSINDFFAVRLSTGLPNTDIDFGAKIKQADGTIISEIAWSSIFDAVLNTTGVRRIDEGSQGLLLNSLRQSVSLLVREFPIPGTITIYDVDAGAAL
jgi:hypothetical protein